MTFQQFIAYITIISVAGITVTAINVRTSPKVIGGTEIAPHEFKHLVYLILHQRLYCAGSIIHPSWVLTAAQCASYHPSYYILYAGDHNRSLTESSEQQRRIDRILLHPRWEAPGAIDFEGDIALFHVSIPFTFNEYVQPVEYVEQDFPEPATATVVGWGTVDDSETMEDIARKVTVPYVNDTTCASFHGQDLIVSSMVCYGEEGKDSCTGDSGGPLMCADKLCGLVSWGRGCGLPNFPGVYTQLSYFSNWISSQIGHYAEDPDPISQVLECGGIVNSTSARISLSLTMGKVESCAWMITIPLDRVRIVLRSMLDLGNTVHVTEFVRGTNLPSWTRQLVLPNLNHPINGPFLLISLSSTAESGQIITIDIFGSGIRVPTKTNNLVHLSAPIGQGSFSYPVNGENYPNNDFSLFMVSPLAMANTTFTFTRFRVEYSPDCTYDGLSVYPWNGTMYNLEARLCRNAIPEPINTEFGKTLFIFKSDAAISDLGFEFVW